ncbi:MAG TPA: DUF4406 domain-containing protein [Oscillospiraceae bacterium]|nr:DUF4406 domain-containing protein [Oscillospiraceae bacterium]
MEQMIFVCSPYCGDVETNTKLARQYCRYTAGKGFIPIAPHLLFPQFMDDNITEERERAIQMNLGILKRCYELWVFGRETTIGMWQEIKAAQELGIPVRYVSDAEVTECC